MTAAEAAGSEGISVALVEQPYRVAGRRSPPRAPQLDAAWISAVERLCAGELAGLPLAQAPNSDHAVMNASCFSGLTRQVPVV